MTIRLRQARQDEKLARQLGEPKVACHTSVSSVLHTRNDEKAARLHFTSALKIWHTHKWQEGCSASQEIYPVLNITDTPRHDEQVALSASKVAFVWNFEHPTRNEMARWLQNLKRVLAGCAPGIERDIQKRFEKSLCKSFLRRLFLKTAWNCCKRLTRRVS